MENFDFLVPNANYKENEQVGMVCEAIVNQPFENIYDGRNHYAPKVGVFRDTDGKLKWRRKDVLFYPSERVMRRALDIFKEKGYHPYYDNDVCFYRVAKDRNEVTGRHAIAHTNWL